MKLRIFITSVVMALVLTTALPLSHWATGGVQSAGDAPLINDKLPLKKISTATDEVPPPWSEGKDIVLEDPPNAILSSFTADGNVVNVVVLVKNPGKMPEKVQAVSLFIDVPGCR